MKTPPIGGVVVWEHTQHPYRYTITAPRFNGESPTPGVYRVLTWQVVNLNLGLYTTIQTNPDDADATIPPTDHISHRIFTHLYWQLQYWEDKIQPTLDAARTSGYAVVYYCGGPLDGYEHKVPADKRGRPPLWRQAAQPVEIAVLRVHDDPDPAILNGIVDYTRGRHPQPDGRWLYHLEGEQP